MIEQLNTYFKAEKSESLLFMLAGLLAAAFAVYAFFVLKQKFYTGIAIPLLLVGIIQLVVGSSVYFRTDSQIAQLEAKYTNAPAAMANDELPRMHTVMKNFTLYKYIEVAFIIGGVLLILLLRRNEFWLGAGMGLLAQGSIMLLLDIFAERRAETYIAFLQTLLL
jgi:hypothetical protein